MIKKELREFYKEKRKSVSLKEKMKWDDLLLLQMQKLNFTGVHVVLSYWPMADINEPNTHLFSSYLKHMFPDIQIAYPVGDMATAEMKAIATHEDTVFHTSSIGILEPKEGDELLPAGIDLIFVPLLICDENGYRVGFGKGFYDRYLQKCKKDVIKMGFSYFAPVNKIDDTNQFDVPLNYCITPESIYEF